MKALCIGSKGFVSSFMVNQLIEKGWDVYKFNLRDGEDIRDYETVRNKLDIVRPNVVYHFAAQAAPAESFLNPKRTFEVNTIGSLNLLEAVRHLGIITKIVLISTSEVYGDNTPEEDARLEPRSPYAISKCAMDQLGQLYNKAYGMDIVVTRAFNHTGPGRGEVYAEASFAKQIAEIEVGKREFLEHGNLDSVRNYTDVRDIVRAYEMLHTVPSGVYNICSDRNVSMTEVLEILKSYSNHNIKTKTNSRLVRPADFSFLQPNCNKLKQYIDWSPEIPLEKTLKEILQEWRSKV